MTVWESIILVIVIGFTTILTGYCIIQKIFDESRKNSDKALQQISEAFSMIPKVMSDAVHEIQKVELKEEEERKAIRAQINNDFEE